MQDMTVLPLGSNQTELRLPSGVRILVSYQTPVAAYHPLRGYMRCAGERRTTVRHINRWCGKGVGKIVSRKEIADLLSSAPAPQHNNAILGAQPRVIHLEQE